MDETEIKVKIKMVMEIEPPKTILFSRKTEFIISSGNPREDVESEKFFFRNTSIILSSLLRLTFTFSFLYGLMILCFITSNASNVYSQTPYYAPNTNQAVNNYVKSSVFRQEIARFEINVVRSGKAALPITQVPRVQQGDVIKVKLLDEIVNGIKLDQSQWDWSFLVAFINPIRRMSETVGGSTSKGILGTASEEINFRKRGWYKEYSFIVPYDSQAVFFLYPKAKYRKQLLKVINSKYEQIRKLGEKTIELGDAYSKIDTFLNELQLVLNRNAQIFDYSYPNNNTSANSSLYNSYNSYNPYNLYNSYPTNPDQNVPVFGLGTVPALNQMIEGLAKSFNIQLPACWGNNSNYASFGSTSYGTGYNSGYSSYTSGLVNNNAVMDFVSRAQCVAKNLNLQDFDVSVTRMWQQGGVFLAAELQRKYPQIAYWINIAAAAIDFMMKVWQKSPLRIVPTIIQSSDNQSVNGGQGTYGNTGTGAAYGNSYPSSGYSNNYLSGASTPSTSNAPPPVKISLFADSQPADGQFMTAYPIVLHKWQPNPDPEVISLNPPVLAEPCLHPGTNLLKSTDLSDQWSDDNYSRDFRLVISSANGFRKEFPLRKNIGLGSWELNMTQEDINAIPRVDMNLEAEVIGTRGFNEIKSPKFALPISLGGTWELTPESQKSFTVGGKRTITLRNNLASCRCLQRVIYKPPSGGLFVFEAHAVNNQGLIYSPDGREVSFEIDATGFQPGAGTLELKTYGPESLPMQNNLSPQTSNSFSLKLYPALPIISDVQARRGDREILLTGERLEQLQSITINGKRAIMKDKEVRGQPNNQVMPGRGESNDQTTYPNNNQFATQPNQSQDVAQTPAASFPMVSGTSSQSLMPARPATASVSNPYRNLSPNQRVVVFEDSNTKVNIDAISLELRLEDNRTFTYPQKFMAGISRPAIRANELNEIDGVFLERKINVANRQPKQEISNLSRVPNYSSLDVTPYPVVSIDRSEMTLTVQNILTDYDFRLENLSVETRIENSGTTPSKLPKVIFDLLDTNNLRLNFSFDQETNKNLSGRRLQFRIRDRERGDSDWYTIKQTFIRIPNIESVKCTTEMKDRCELKGEGLDYIAQVSTDGGRNWYPTANDSAFQARPTQDGKLVIMIPPLLNKKFLQIKLRDFLTSEGLPVLDFRFLNTAKNSLPKPASLNK